MNPLLFACKGNSALATEALLELGADIDNAHPETEVTHRRLPLLDPSFTQLVLQTTALMIASREGSDRAVASLLKHRKWSPEQLEEVDQHGNTALLLTALQGHVKIGTLLLEAGANGRAVNAQGNNAWQVSSFFCVSGKAFVDTIFKHVEKKFIDEQAPNGRNALMLTGVQWGHASCHTCSARSAHSARSARSAWFLT